MAEEKNNNETIEGGKYIVNGETVDAWGEPIKKAAKNETEAEETADAAKTKAQPRK